MRTRNIFRLAPVLAGVVTACLLAKDAPALGQVYVPPPPVSYDMWGFQNTRMSILNRALQRRSAERVTRPTSAPRPAPRDTRGDASLTFRPTSSSIVPAALASRHPATAQRRREVQAYFARILEHYHQALRTNGGRPRDVARAVSYAIANSYVVLRGERALGNAQLEGLRRQIREALASDADFARLSDRDRQEMYEINAIFGTYLMSLYEEATRSGNRGELERVRALASGHLQGIFARPAVQLRATTDGIR